MSGTQTTEVTTGHKPKMTTDHKLKKAAETCKRLGIKDVIVPASVILLERYKARKAPVGAFESYVFSHLAKWEELGIIEKLEPGIKGYKAIPTELKSMLFPRTLIDWDLHKPLDDAVLFGSAWIAEGVAHSKTVLYDDPVPTNQPGQIRPWMGQIFDVDTLKKYLAPWPWIEAVNTLRTRDHIPSLSKYEMNEYETKCNYSKFNPDTNQVNVSFDVNNGTCSIPVNRAPDGNCLRVPEVRPGESVEIMGFNFWSKDCKVRIRSMTPGGFTGEIPAVVHGDQFTPVKDANNNVIVGDRVKDRLIFVIPTDIPEPLYGDYVITVVVPNDVNYDFEGEAVSNPAYENDKRNFLSNGVYLRVLPSGNEKYRIWLDTGICYDQTDGEWFSDEVYVAGFPVLFTPDSVNPTHLPNSGTTIWGDVDQYERKRDWNWNPMGSDFNSTFSMKNTTLALGLVGYEVDDEDALMNNVRSFGDAYVQYLGLIWKGVVAGVSASAGGLSVSDGLKALAAKLGVGWSLFVAGIVFAAIFGVGLIFAGWAPADMIFKDVIVLSETDLFNLTQPHAAMPQPIRRQVDDDIHVTVFPTYTDNFIYLELRRYTSNEQGSDYGFIFKYQQS
jgi:hypothetical protein